jgi:hypothetical protein
MSLKKLAEEIQKNPDMAKGLIDGYSDVCDQSTAFFLQSIKKNVVYVIPSLILAFEASKDSGPTTINRIAEKMSVGTIFELVSNDESYQYTGVNCNGDVTAVKLGTSFQKEFHGNEVIRRVF